MSLIQEMLLPPINRIRRNHALEHATLQVLARIHPARMMAGYSDKDGFWLVGDVGSDAVQAAVNEALTRLLAGEHGLAVHPNCGTNIVVSGIAAGTAAWLGMLSSKGWRDKFDRWPLVVSLATVGLILAMPLGPLLQAKVTTDAHVEGLEVISITHYTRQGTPLHRIITHS